MISFLAGMAVGAYAYRVAVRWWEERQFKKYLEVLKDRGFDEDDFKPGGSE